MDSEGVAVSAVARAAAGAGAGAKTVAATAALVCILLVVLTARPASAQELVREPETVKQGDPAVFVFEWSAQTGPSAVPDEDAEEAGLDRATSAATFGDLGRSAFLSLESPEEGRILTTRCFPLEEDRWTCMAGISSTRKPGSYRASIVLGGAVGGSRELTTELQIEEREFRRETIPLDRSLTRLRSEPDERKAEEAATLAELIARFDPDAVYHRGPFTLPVEDARKTSLFGDRRTYQYVDGASANAVHYGLDLAAETGTGVRAGGAGRVVMADERIISGNTVVIEHLPGVYGLHYHLDEIRVAEDDVVEPDTEIGTVGSTGLATGPHLHWEVRVARVPVEPEMLLSEGLIDTVHYSRDTMYRKQMPEMPQ